MSKSAHAKVQLKMKNITYNNLQEFCRICLKQLQAATTSGNSYNFHSEPQLALLLKIFVSLDVLKEPNKFPNRICKECYKTVFSYEQFRNVAEQSETTLQRIVQEAATEKEQEAPNATAEPNKDDQLLLPELLPDTTVKAEPMEEEVALDNRDISVKNQRSSTPIKDEPIDQQSIDLNNDAYECYSDVDETEFMLRNVEMAMAEEDEDTLDMSFLDGSLDECANISGRTRSHSTKKRGPGHRRTLKCKHCDKQAYKLVYLEAHIRAVHEGCEKPFLCQKCPMSFTRYNQLHEHYRTIHPAVLEEVALQAVTELTCQQCQRKYSSKRALDQHLKRHAQIKEHICKHCGVGKVTRTELLIHLRTHQPNLEKFKCTMCPQLFNHKNAITRHIRVVHEGLRRFKCAFCNKSFGTRNSQERHELLHSDERPFACNACEKKFTHLDRLTSHMRSHDKKTWPFQCRYCTKPCISRQNLVAHERRHNGEKPHICNICSKGFIKIEELDTHKQIHSPEEEL